MNTDFDYNQIAQQHAEGKSAQALDLSARYGSLNNLGSAPIFQRFVVIDVISDPSSIDDTKLNFWIHNMNLMNPKAGVSPPRNSILAKRVLNSGLASVDTTMILYPFFPSHIALPTKPGEHVWVFFENPDAKLTEIAYWMCKISLPAFVEDVNYTHADRTMDPSFNPGTAALHNGSANPVYEYRNGAADEKNGQRFSVADTISIFGDENAYKELFDNADAEKIIIKEPVPRFKKRPGDLVLEGSNNSVIALGTHRINSIADLTFDQTKGNIPALSQTDKQEGSAMIDMIVGRGQTTLTGGSKVNNATTSTFEIGKSKDEVVAGEGDPDFVNDKSRILLGQKLKVDQLFKLSQFNSQFITQVSDSQNGDAAVVLKSDKVRLIARSDIEILVTNSSVQNGVLTESQNPDEFAAIVIKANGDIVFKPAAKGVVKLGGDDANLAVLCTSVNNTGQGGIVTASPIIDSMAGSQGASGGVNGTFATKILLK